MFYIYTYATDITRLEYFYRTATIHNLNVRVLMDHKWTGFYSRMLAIKEELNKLDDNDICLFTDSYDVLINANVEKILETFHSFHSELVFSTEMCCFPSYLENNYKDVKSSTNYKYVNAGGYIGTVHALRKMFSYKPLECVKTPEDDQAFISNYYLLNKNVYKLDTEQKLFQTMMFVPLCDMYIENGFIKNRVLSTCPCIVHFNGCTWLSANQENMLPFFTKALESNDTIEFNHFKQLVDNIRTIKSQK
jgi:hypothetical protein